MEALKLSSLPAANEPRHEYTYAEAQTEGLIDVGAPTVPERTYKIPRFSQQILGLGDINFAKGEKPVVMRGAMWSIARRYSPMYWYFEQVWTRYIRMRRLTFLYRADLNKFLRDLERRPIRNHHLRNARVDTAIQIISHKVGYGYGNWGAVVDGEFLEMNDYQYATLCTLHKQIEKINKLEQRRTER